MQRNYLIGFHYRTAGIGEPVVLLHPSPRSGQLLEPLGNRLAERFHVIIPDLPGYGNSDPLPETPASLYDYLPPFRAFFQELGLTKFNVYGSATGAQLAIAYALTHPGDIIHLYLDNAAHFTETQRQRIMGGYFPDFTPQPDGSHLVRLWEHVVAGTQFFPWFEQTEETRFATAPPPADSVQDIVTDYLRAGRNWDWAYRAAFGHERAEHVQRLTVPTTLFRWQGSILLPYIDQLIAEGLPANVRVVEIPKAPVDRLGAMVEHLAGT